MAANDPEAFGSTSNNWGGSSLAFISLCELVPSDSQRGTWPWNPYIGYGDVPTWKVALAGKLKQDYNGTGTTLMNLAKAEALAFVAGHVTDTVYVPGDGWTTLGSDEYQHAEDVLGGLAITVDCCYEVFTSGERATVATWLNIAMQYMESANRIFWPGAYAPSGKEAVNNNYFNNQTLTWAMVGLCSEGWNASASAHRAHFESIAANYIAFFNGDSQGSGYTGPQISEGRYYSQYFRNAMWGMKLYDAAMGTTFLSQLGASGTTPEAHLEMAFFEQVPRGARCFFDGSEPNSNIAFIGDNGSEFMYCMAYMMSSSNTLVRVLKTIVNRTDYVADSPLNWSRHSKGFWNFYANLRPVSALPVTSLTQRRLAQPAIAGGRTWWRSAGGWDGTATNRASVIFAGRTEYSGTNNAGYSHANPDVPGFQLSQGADRVVTDVEFQDGGTPSPSGIGNEQASDSGNRWANIITLASSIQPGSNASPVHLFNEDNTGGSIPYFYMSVNAQPVFSTCTIYRREYVALDDLQVYVIFDRVATPSSDAKTFRLHVDATAGVTVASGVATWTTGSTSGRLRDLYSTDGNVMTAGAPGESTIYAKGLTIRRIAQSLTSNDVRSLKVLDLNSRCSAASLSSGAGYLQADMTINSVARSVRFFDDGSHATVS